MTIKNVRSKIVCIQTGHFNSAVLSPLVGFEYPRVETLPPSGNSVHHASAQWAIIMSPGVSNVHYYMGGTERNLKSINCTNFTTIEHHLANSKLLRFFSLDMVRFLWNLLRPRRMMGWKREIYQEKRDACIHAPHVVMVRSGENKSRTYFHTKQSCTVTEFKH